MLVWRGHSCPRTLGAGNFNWRRMLLQTAIRPLNRATPLLILGQECPNYTSRGGTSTNYLRWSRGPTLTKTSPANFLIPLSKCFRKGSRRVAGATELIYTTIV